MLCGCSDGGRLTPGANVVATINLIVLAVLFACAVADEIFGVDILGPFFAWVFSFFN